MKEYSKAMQKIREYLNLCVNILNHNDKLRVNYVLLMEQIEKNNYP